MTAIGLTWDHPRGYNALAAAAKLTASPDGSPLLSWEKQPLEGFESAPIGELAERYDLLVIDHPHIGEAVALGCLRPLEDFYSFEQLQAWSGETVGAATSSYRWQGQHWALPLDVATQVMVRHPDLVATPPDDWEGVVRQAESGGVALSLAGPHAILNVFSIAACYGKAPGGEALLDDQAFEAALSLLRRLHALVPPGSDRLNPIGLLAHMAQHDNIALVPLVYGYVNYAATGMGRGQLAFSDAPRLAGGACRGSVLGGTGIAFSARFRPSPELLAHIAGLLSPDMQQHFIPRHDGQPSRRSAYLDARVNAAWGDFYRDTIATCETALLRPRHDGYIAFQTQAAGQVRDFLGGRGDVASTISDIRSAWRANLAQARGPIELQTRQIKRIPS